MHQDPFQILLHIRSLMPKQQFLLSGILAQFPDTHFPSVRHSHAQSHHRPCPTIRMPAAHRVRWSSRLNKASFVIPRLRSCDFSSLLPLSFPHTRSFHYPQGFFADRNCTVVTALGGSEALRMHTLYSIGAATTSRYLPTPSWLFTPLAFALQERT